MGDGTRPPLHDKAIQSATERADRLRTEIVDHIKGGDETKSATMSRFPTYHLEPFQLQRAQALERAIAVLPDAMVEDQLKAAHYIETGHIPDA